MAIVLNIITVIVGIVFSLYGAFVVVESVRGDGDAFAGVNMIAVPLVCVILSLLLPPFREFATNNLQILFVLVGVLIVCTGILSCFDAISYLPGIVNGIGLILLGVWSSGIIPEQVIYPMIYGLANILSAFFIPVLVIMIIFVILKNMFF